MKKEYTVPSVLDSLNFLTRDYVCASYNEQVVLDESSLDEDHLNW